MKAMKIIRLVLSDSGLLGVKFAIDLLKYLDWATDVTAENRKSYEMQARCLRVFYYNMLWHYFGNVPFYLENLSKPPYTRLRNNGP